MPQGNAQVPGFLSFAAFKNGRRHLPVGNQKVVGVNELAPLINDTEGENTSQCHLKICSSTHPFQLGRQVRYYHPKLISPKKVKKVYQEIKYIKTNLENPNIGKKKKKEQDLIQFLEQRHYSSVISSTVDTAPGWFFVLLPECFVTSDVLTTNHM